MKQEVYEHIKNKIEHLDKLPIGSSFNAEEVWKKMEQQLQTSTHRKKHFVWLGWVAIISLPILLLFIWHNQTKQIQHKPIVEKSALPQQENIVTLKPANNTIVVDTEKNTLVKKQKNIHPINNHHIEIPEEIITTNNVSVIDTSTTIAQQPIKEDSTIQQTHNKPKPALRIVHINELNIPKPIMVDNQYEKKQKQNNGLLKNFWLFKIQETIDF